ncbi:amidohydrolase [Aeromicrobium sp. CFBP 8757]|uniref:amidohydrolase n=1 Tax=Aeromicrobium sp. CFBP 8757 TaxID=2775288 RepID=UPI0017875976|nr:amidohydrolase [Aeromicrobium sp. CFBP 8757]MBD8606426.1 amidohydrolase [Aeromicrobium sp. CFBP 8757]
MGADASLTKRLEDVYRDLHAHPELSFAEKRTAGVAAVWLRTLGYEVETGVAVTGVVGVLRRGPGPVVLLRADMDALPVEESTGLSYASDRRARGPDGDDVPVMHACGHDMHVTCLMGAAAVLAATSWTGTLVVLFQPAEEVARGATAMIASGLYERVPTPDVVLGQHVAPLPAGIVGLRSGPAFAATDSLRVTLIGRGGHGSRPEATIDPVVMAAATVMRLQTVVSREIAAPDTAVLTVGAVSAGTTANVIPERAELLLNVRTYDPAVHATVLGAIARIVASEAAASGEGAHAVVETIESAPAVVNDPAAVERTLPALESVVGPGHVIDPGVVTGSEDVGVLAEAAGASCVYWLLGGADPATFAGSSDPDDVRRRAASLPSNHSPAYAPTIQPTLTTGVDCLVAAALAWWEPPR